MTPEDRPRFAEALEAAATVYSQQLSKPLLNLWWTLCQQLTIEEFTQALEAHLRTSQFMPKPADVLTQSEGTPDTRAHQAWLKVLQAMRTHGSYASVRFDDPLIHLAIQACGGWLHLCSTEAQDLHWAQRRFADHYAHLEAHPPEHQLPYLAGRFELENRAAGQPIEPPRLIGHHAPSIEYQPEQSSHASARIAEAVRTLGRGKAAETEDHTGGGVDA